MNGFPKFRSLWGGETQEQMEFERRAAGIKEKHFAQSSEKVQDLNKKYAQPVLGKIGVWELVQLLGKVIDPTDRKLWAVSQWTHSLQVASAMKRDGVQGEEMFLMAVLHDVGKILALTGEAPENVFCDNAIVGPVEAGKGWDQCVFHWNHDEFAYLRFRDLLPPPFAKLIRYHSVNLPRVEAAMNNEDRAWCEKYLKPFMVYDRKSKSIYQLPEVSEEELRTVVEKHFPKPILF